MRWVEQKLFFIQSSKDSMRGSVSLWPQKLSPRGHPQVLELAPADPFILGQQVRKGTYGM
jgi:hypothetical protein